MGVTPPPEPPAGSPVASTGERLGNPWAALPFFSGIIVLPAALLVGASAAAVYGWSHAASEFGVALVGMGGMVVAGGVLLVALGLLVANPRRARAG
jgi:ABC-type xylose transport system permease subunit